jgi:hypothetical protein
MYPPRVLAYLTSTPFCVFEKSQSETEMFSIPPLISEPIALHIHVELRTVRVRVGVGIEVGVGVGVGVGVRIRVRVSVSVSVRVSVRVRVRDQVMWSLTRPHPQRSLQKRF